MMNPQPIVSGGGGAGGIPLGEKGVANGVATLGADGKIPATQIPSAPYDVSVFLAGPPDVGEVLLTHVVARHIVFPAGFAGSVAYAGTVATADTILSVRVNGANVGTIVFRAGLQGADFAASAITLAPGDRLEIVAPALLDVTLAGLSITLSGTR